MRKCLPLLFAVLLLTVSSCRRGVFYEEILPVKNETWTLDDTLHFAFDITDTMQYYTIYMDIRNSIDYETQNLYLFMDSEDPRGNVNRDTLEFLLADAHGDDDALPYGILFLTFHAGSAPLRRACRSGRRGRTPSGPGRRRRD